MHHLIQRGRVRSQVINVPEGLPELLSDITREVLRCQPTSECLCHFVIDYLHSIISTRDKARIAKSIIDRALRTVDDAIADLCICNISKEKSDYLCVAMEECFRRFLAQRRCEKGKNKEIVKFNEFDMLDELVQKCKFTDDELKISKPVMENAYQKFVYAYMTAKENTDGTDCLYQYFRERELGRIEQRLREESAIKIQSNFRGYLVRKSLFVENPVKHPSSLAAETELDKIQLDMAALKIQRFFRRHISSLKNIDVDKGNKIDSEDPCSPASDVSLTARPADHHDIHEENYDTNQNQDQKQDEQNPNETSAEKLDDHKDLQNNLKISEEVAEEKDLENDDEDDGIKIN